MLRKSLTLFLSCILSALVLAGEPLSLQVVSPYIELRTGPGKHYPIHYIGQRGETIEVIKSRTDWFKVRLQINTNNQTQGWVHSNALAKTIALDTKQPATDHPRLASTYSPKWSAGFSLGKFNEADIVGGFLSYAIADTTTIELHAGEYMGGTEQGWFSALQFHYAPYEFWRVSPFVALGYGYLGLEAKSSQPDLDDVDDNYFHNGAGFNFRLSEKYRLRFEYKQFNVLTSTNDNKELESWHIAFASKI
jgi:uncharacterized protein YgiM (DUF1202 family)